MDTQAPTKTLREALEKVFPFLELREESTPRVPIEDMVFGRRTGQNITEDNIMDAAARHYEPVGWKLDKKDGKLSCWFTRDGSDDVLQLTATVYPTRVLVSVRCG